MKTIELKDIGRPRSLRIPIPEDGGVVLLTGDNGVGKSTTLAAVEDGITNRKEKRSKPRDGVASGSLNGCGIKMTVGRKITRTGELTVESLDGGRLSIADVVSPPFKGAEEADGRRIKALVQLAGVEADPELFAGLHPLFHSLIDLDECDTEDILHLADQVKRAFEAHARGAEGQRDIAKQQALACEEAAKGINLEVETDAGVLQLALEAAVRRGQELISAARTARQRNAEIVEARKKIDAVKRTSTATPLDEARGVLAVAESNLTFCVGEVERLRAEMAKAEINASKARDDRDHWKSKVADAEALQETLAEWEKTVAAGEMVVPADEVLAEADEKITKARQAIEAGAAARAAKVKLEQAEKHRQTEAEKATAAEQLRTAAASVDNVLTEQIATLGSPLRVEAGRLVTKTDRGPSTFYAELSDGERWRMATEIAVKAVGRGGLLTVPQAAFSELSPRSRQMIHEIAKEAGVVILSAIATDDPDIEAVPFEELEVASV